MGKTIHVVSILDRSGSMGGTEKEVIGAYNAFIEDHKKIAKEKNAKFKTTLVLFDNEYEEVYSKVPIEQTPELTSKEYFVRGMTAYFDSLGKSITKFDGKEKVIFFIETDGQENASQEFKADTIKALVEKKKADGWDFNFVGADLDAATTRGLAATLGIDANKTVAFNKSAEGYEMRNRSFAASTMAYVDNVTSESTDS